MRRFIYLSLAGVLLPGMATGCYVSRKETVRELPTSKTTVERRSTVETAPADETETVRTRTTTEKSY